MVNFEDGGVDLCEGVLCSPGYINLYSATFVNNNMLLVKDFYLEKIVILVKLRWKLKLRENTI